MSDIINEKGELEKRPLFQRSVDTQALISYFLKLSMGEIASYEELSTVIGTNLVEETDLRKKDNIKKRLYGLIRTAKRSLMLDHRVFLATVRGVGVKRIDDTDTARSLGSGAQKVQREATRNLETAKCINLDKVDPSEKPVLVMRMATFQLVQHVHSPDSQKKLQGAVNVLPEDHFTNADLLRALQRPEE